MNEQKIMLESIGSKQASLLLNMSKCEEAINEGNISKMKELSSAIFEDIFFLKKCVCIHKTFFIICQFANKLIQKLVNIMINQNGTSYIRENAIYDFQEHSRITIENIKFEKRILSELYHQLKIMKKSKNYDSLLHVFSLLFLIMSMHYNFFNKRDDIFTAWYCGLRGIQYINPDDPNDFTEEDIVELKQMVESNLKDIKLS